MAKVVFMKVSRYYDDYIKNLKNYNNYHTAYETLMSDYYDWGDAWKFYLETTGNYEGIEIVINNRRIQQIWAQENKVSYSEDNWMFEILEAQIKYYRPKILFAHEYTYITNNWIKYIKDKYHQIGLVIGYDGVGLNDINRFKNYDYMLTCLKSTAKYYSNNGLNTYYLPFAFDTRILEKIIANPKIKSYEFTFIGSIFPMYHQKRKELIKSLIRKTPLKIWTNNYENQWKFLSKYQILKLIQFDFYNFYNNLLISYRRKEPIYGLRMYQVIANSKLTLNSHGDKETNEAANRRLFEVTGVGSCIITDWKENILDFFEPGKEIVTYNSIEECISVVDYYLKNDSELQKVSNAGQIRTISNHNLKDRIQTFEKEVLSKLLK